MRTEIRGHRVSGKEEIKHLHRMLYCAKLALREIARIKDSRANKILKKYSVEFVGETWGLKFPKNFRETSLPKSMRLKGVK